MLLPVPQTGNYSLTKHFLPGSLHASSITEASTARSHVRTVLKSLPATQNWTEAIQAINEYLPSVYGTIACQEADELLVKTEISPTWSFGLSSTSPPGIPAKPIKVTFVSLHFELACLLHSLALLLINQSATMVSTLGEYETSSSVSNAGIQNHDETINAAADHLCRASGIFTHLTEVIIPQWESTMGDELRLRPVELTRDFAEGLSKLCLADANLLAIRRLMSRTLSTAHTAITPGPPLSSTHPSPSLLAKLHLHVFSLYNSARTLIKSAGDASTGHVVPELRRYLSDGRGISLGLSYKWLAIDAGEKGGREKVGAALGWLGMAREEITQIEGKSKGIKALKIGNGKRAGKTRRSKIEQELESIQVFFNAYKKVNDTVHFQPVTPNSILQTLVPAGRAAVFVKPYTPPIPGFKPRLDGARPAEIPPPKNEYEVDPGSESEDEWDLRGNTNTSYFGEGNYW